MGRRRVRAQQGARACLLTAVALAALVGSTRRAAARAVHQPVWPRFGAELRVTPYRPFLNSAADVAAVRRVVWDNADKSLIRRHPLMLSAGLAWYAIDDFGLLGPMLQVGYWSQSGPARKCLDAESNVVQCTPQSVLTSVTGTDTATLLAIPISAGALYRYDLLRRNFAIPLSFHAKAGLSYTLWWGSLGSTTAVYHGRSAKGGTLGWYAAAGLSLALNGLGKRDAMPYGYEGKSAPDAGLFVEYSLLRDVVPGTRRLNFGDNTAVTLGLNIDFR